MIGFYRSGTGPRCHASYCALLSPHRDEMKNQHTMKIGLSSFSQKLLYRFCHSIPPGIQSKGKGECSNSIHQTRSAFISRFLFSPAEHVSLLIYAGSPMLQCQHVFTLVLLQTKTLKAKVLGFGPATLTHFDKAECNELQSAGPDTCIKIKVTVTRTWLVR